MVRCLGCSATLALLRSILGSNWEQMPLNGERQLLRDREARAEDRHRRWGNENSLTRMWNVSCSGQSSMWGSAAQVFRRKVRKLQDPVGAPKGSRSRPSAAGKPTCLVCLFRGSRPPHRAVSTSCTLRYVCVVRLLTSVGSSATDQAARHKLQCVPELPHGMHRERCIIQDQNHTSQDIRLGA